MTIGDGIALAGFAFAAFGMCAVLIKGWPCTPTNPKGEVPK